MTCRSHVVNGFRCFLSHKTQLIFDFEDRRHRKRIYKILPIIFYIIVGQRKLFFAAEETASPSSSPKLLGLKTFEDADFICENLSSLNETPRTRSSSERTKLVIISRYICPPYARCLQDDGDQLHAFVG